MSAPARRSPSPWQDRITIPLDVASHAATFTAHFHKCKHPFVVESVEYINPTGLAADPTNAFDIELKDGATSMAKWSTITGTAGQGTIAADTFVQLALSATLANQYTAQDDILALVLTLHGAQTLPAGRLVVHGRYL